MIMTGALMFDSIIGLACGVTHVGLDFRLSEINRPDVWWWLILTLSNAFIGIDNREMKSESGFSFAIASQPFWLPLHPKPFSFTQLTCVSHHGKSSEHVRDNVHNHSAVLRHVLAVHWTEKYTKAFFGLPPSLDMRYVPVRLVSMTAFQPWGVLLFKICF